jgi:carbon starvation protein
LPNALPIAALSGVALYLGYRFYGRVIARLWDFHPDRPTPATESPDGVDYVAAKHWTVLFGHHFASIAGVGPIVGPVLACAIWGWLPALIWILVGSIFFGAVHDFSSLMASLRARGRSIAEIAEENLGHRVRVIFGGFLWLALILVVAVFAHFGARTLAITPQVVIPTFGVILVAIAVGLMMYRWGVPQSAATVLGLGLLGGFLYLGYRVPIELPFGEENVLAWTIILLAYAYFASITPVNLLLQPRDYLSTFVLYIGLVAGYVGIVLTRPDIDAPPMQSVSGSLGPLWPMLFVTVACGAISGFHSLIASGTTAKQLGSEANAPRIGYGAMILEGALALLAVMAVAAGLRWGSSAGAFPGILDEGGPLPAFANGFAVLTKPFFGPLGALVGLTVLKTFVMTTLDSATRISRYVGEELFGESLGIGILHNRFVATGIIIGLAFFLATGSWQTVWPVFGSANQLIAALALLVLTVVLWRRGKPTIYTLVPLVFMFATALGALVYQGRDFWAEQKFLLCGISVALVALALVMLVDSLRVVLHERRAAPTYAEARCQATVSRNPSGTDTSGS